MGADLVGAHYPLNGVYDALYGQARNAAQGNAPIRSNLEYLGIGGGLTDTAGATVAASGVMAVVPVPVDIGTEISKVSVLVGATAASLPTHSIAALYQGFGASPALMAQSTDQLTTAIPASTRYDISFATPYVVGSNANDAPNGYIFVAYSCTATTLPSLVTNAGTIAAACQYAWFTNSPGHGAWSLPGTLAATAGAAVGGTAPSTYIIIAQKTVAPLVFVS